MRAGFIVHHVVVYAVALAAFMSPRQVAAQSDQPAAVDNQRLADQSPQTQALFESTWGSNAPERWVAEHNAEYFACAAGKALEDARLHADALRTYAELLKPTTSGPQPPYTSPSTTVLAKCATDGIHRVLSASESEVADPCAAASALMDAHLYDEAMKAYADVLKPNAAGSQTLPQTSDQLEQRKHCAQNGIENAFISKILERVAVGAADEAAQLIGPALEAYNAAVSDARSAKNMLLDRVAAAAIDFAEKATERLLGGSADPFAVAHLLNAEDRHADALTEAQRVVAVQPGLAVPTDLLSGAASTPTPGSATQGAAQGQTHAPPIAASGAVDQALPVLLLVLLVALEFAYMAWRHSF